MRVQQILVVVLLVVTLLVPTGIAEKGKRKNRRQKQASGPSATPPKALPTEEGWAHGDTITGVKDLFATANALAARGEYVLAAEGFGEMLRIMPDNPVARVEFARNNDRARKMKAKAAQDDKGADPEAVEIIGQHKE